MYTIVTLVVFPSDDYQLAFQGVSDFLWQSAGFQPLLSTCLSERKVNHQTRLFVIHYVRCKTSSTRLPSVNNSLEWQEMSCASRRGATVSVIWMGDAHLKQVYEAYTRIGNMIFISSLLIHTCILV